MCAGLGLDPSSIPKMLSVRFRVIEKLAKWLVKDDACVFAFIEDLAERVKSGRTVPTETESVLLKNYWGKYIETLLTASFLAEVSAPIIDFIDFFENQTKSKLHKRHEETISFLFLLMSKFLKNGGMKNSAKVTAGRILKVDVEDPSLQLDDEELWLGSTADDFLKESKLTRKSKEVQPWLAGVRAFYGELVKKAVKYFRDGLESKTLQYCSVLDPNNCIALELDLLKKKFGYLAAKFPNIIPENEVPALLAEVALMKAVPRLEQYLDMSPEEFWHLLRQTGEGRRFRRLPDLAQALLTVYNSNSAAETDFSIQNSLVGDGRRNQCSQDRLNGRMLIKSHNFLLRKHCQPCTERQREIENGSLEAVEQHDEEDDDMEDDENNVSGKKLGKLRHCHCSLFRPSPELLNYMGDGQPKQRFNVEQMARRKERERIEGEKRIRREIQAGGRAQQLKAAVDRLKKVQKKDEEEKKGKSAGGQTGGGNRTADGVGAGGSKAKKAKKRKMERQAEKEAKLSKLDFL